MPTTYDEVMASIEANRKRAAEGADEVRQQLVHKMIMAGIRRCDIRFYGSGDSGSIEEVEFTPPQHNNRLCNEIEKWAYSFLEGTGVDWYNNEGGQGHITFDIDNRTFEYEVEYNVMTTEVGASGEEPL